MKRNKTIVLLFLLAVSVISWGKSSRIDSLLLILDQIIENKATYTAKKAGQLQRLRHKADSLPFGIEKFHALGDLMDEFNTFNTDSSYYILQQRKNLAHQLNDSILILNVLLNRANLLLSTGMYKEAQETIDSVKLEKIPPYLHPYYFHIKRTLYGRLADYAAFPKEKILYDTLTKSYRDSLLNVNDEGSLAYVITLADKYNSEGMPAKAVALINKYINENDLSDHDQAIFSWTLSDSYDLLNDSDSRKKELLVSSIADLQSGIREYVSLRELANILYEEGDLDRAYKYMTVALEDAELANARQRVIELNQLYPKVNEIYVNKISDQKRALGWTIVVISLLSFGVFSLFLYARKEVRIVKESRQAMQKAYADLDETNSRLQEINQQLSIANKNIDEISKMKEVYIGRYMDQCLVYIDKIDSFRKTAVNMLNLNRIDDLKKMVKSSSGINDELHSFYAQFDQTFLSLFPKFIENVNDLLKSEEKIETKKASELTPELRILALIRLGITDSENIAKFLRYSLTTIYNYRTRLRNKARGDRDKFEEEIKKIAE